ncbi:MAG: ABC transporter substrate-binding protein [Desulfopila sp.]
MTTRVLQVALMVLLSVGSLPAAERTTDWQAILAGARGQKVYFNAWGGDEAVNDYIRWAVEQVASRYEVEVVHVKVSDIGEVVGRILAEKNAGRTSGGSVDLLWINGENFRTMKEQGLLPPAYAQLLPNSRLVDTVGKPTTLYDFTVPVADLEVPWGMAQLVFLYDTAAVTSPPASMAELLDFTRKNPGRFAYPAPPDFHGTTFVKQALLELTPDPERLSRPMTAADFEMVTAPLWHYLDSLHPSLWRGGRSFPASIAEMRRLLADGELAISFSFNPNEASNAIEGGELPETVRTSVHDGGTIGNTHFLALVFNSANREGALVFANFLLSPEAQARKADPAIWGDPTVLAMEKLTPGQRRLFESIPLGVATLPPAKLGKVLPEPHPSWVEALEKTWLSRYSK